MRSSKRSGELMLISESDAGFSRIASRLPNRISLIAIVSAALGPEVTEPMCGLSDSVISAYTMSRWRESSGTSLGSQIVPPGGVELVEALREPDEVLEVVHRGLAADVALARERRAVDGREHHVVAADGDALLGVAGLQFELARHLGDLLEHELGVEPDVGALGLAACGAEDLDRLGQDELDADLGDDPAPAAVEHLHRVGRQDLVARHFVLEHAPSGGCAAA